MKTIVLILSFILPMSAASAEDPLLAAMRAELQRAWQGLPKEGEAPLYYLGYQVWDSKSMSASSTLGALMDADHSRSRAGHVDVRVGNMRLDNSHQVKGSQAAYQFEQNQGEIELPHSGDEAALRARLWLGTEEAFRKAQADFTKVIANKQVTAEEEDPSHDFSRSDISVYYQAAPQLKADFEKIQKLSKRLSKLMKPYPFILQSQVSIKASSSSSYQVNSEQSSVVTGSNSIHLSYYVTARTSDGMDLDRYRDWTVTKLEELPSEEEIAQAIQESIAELKQLLEAPLMQPYQGPAIFGPQAAGVYFHEILGHRLEGHRLKLESEGQTFKGKVGETITADFISVFDDPTQSRLGKIPLAGTYKYDDELVAARRVTLVASGKLQGFLMSRNPIEGFPVSNGHGRRGQAVPAVARMGNTIVEASTTVSEEKLRSLLIDSLKKKKREWGLWFKDIQGGFTMTGRGSTQAFKVIPKVVYKVYVDGRPDEMVRGADIVGTPLTSFLKIVAASDTPGVFNGVCGAESGWVPVSAVAPSILIDEIEVEKRDKANELPPLLPPPPKSEEMKP